MLFNRASVKFLSEVESRPDQLDGRELLPVMIMYRKVQQFDKVDNDGRRDLSRAPVRRVGIFLGGRRGTGASRAQPKSGRGIRG
jgi:hypothetical protein